MGLRLAVFGSGRGSNFGSILKAVQNEEIDATIVVVLINNPDALMGEKAANADIPVISIPHEGISREVHENKILSELSRFEFDLVCLAGYMRILSPEFISQIGAPIINIHPSLLPSFPGLHAHKQAIDYGVKVSGCTVHRVNEDVDAGQILGQICIPVLEDDTEETLSKRILEQEHKLYPEIVGKIATGEIKL